MERYLDILCISETWLHLDMSNDFTNITNVNVNRCDAGHGGGYAYMCEILSKQMGYPLQQLRVQMYKISGLLYKAICFCHSLYARPISILIVAEKETFSF